ncbi:MAG: hypothetical protein Pg6B_07210 [Candidatus Azobacteroides pseudotrichonymphae]|jgi:hypothetical protein|nr:MAG: hypothetical protein Pg6B_07210 [Candidatus Azobacteroides pseudotrichonymphae]
MFWARQGRLKGYVTLHIYDWNKIFNNKYVSKGSFALMFVLFFLPTFLSLFVGFSFLSIFLQYGIF